MLNTDFKKSYSIAINDLMPLVLTFLCCFYYLGWTGYSIARDPLNWELRMINMLGTGQWLRDTYPMVGQCVKSWAGSSDVVLAWRYPWMGRDIYKLGVGVGEWPRRRRQGAGTEGGDDFSKLSLGTPG